MSTRQRTAVAPPKPGTHQNANPTVVMHQTAPSDTAGAKRATDFYRQMVFIRRFEERAARAYTQALIGGYCHLNLGEEAAVVGLMAALRPTDYLFTNYREHGYALTRGIDPNRVMAELFGRSDGVSKGWGGSMHMFDLEKRMLGGYGIVGGQIPLATGAALAIDYRGVDEIVMCTMGDGTTNIGAFHESLNIAALWNLPIVYVVINNRLGMATTVDKSSAEPELYKRASSYRMASERVDGLDPVAVFEAAQRAAAVARGGRPFLLEVMTERLRGHSVVDPGKYRGAEEIALTKERDPVVTFAAHLFETGLLTEQEIAAINDGAIAQATAAAVFAEASPFPDVATLFDYTYATPVANDSHRLPGQPLFEPAPYPEHEATR
ncbi:MULTISPECIES: pyruvate dehydrogenase (acetyl-transferring) E1 component subunit alpha [Cryobacterium]|uniref:Pyruvate dehydrogenase E1 component subunit alpha n=1 Tax=Cryobacterium glucosi TaxID=1259175 RepID=A0ABY2ISJ0_9MICO|nr:MULTISPECIES: pyruvate dehydrogenase (acetyl-transferring) E1 component subunit alpha [Cryobacterium]TFB92233.1 pyruvate dehydrogenase (acetyl-transferring) E1 component subunit alpha [Cryobacterium sp. MDB2-A-1]TFC01811.1 pyruvate dehydrogenase (acetyl-transferring) E1 component subunit alpha [Cryobacterium sp. MDB2-33-2]TFC10346.1 pyruvate dehydrogenase (acetyl-transferring) E1 component subunit alpha [Cryobacterium sp. MDB2-A-2]TFC12405.1 pyruvate dehydrogenase (acetyl-transferring) E1 co